MEENGNKGIGSLPIIILLISALLSAACAILGATGIFSNHPVYNDPELSVSLVRGNILDRNGNYLAIQAPDYGFYITMNDSSASECAAFISMWTEENAISIEEKIRNGKIFIPITIIPSSDDLIERMGMLDYGLSFLSRYTGHLAEDDVRALNELFTTNRMYLESRQNSLNDNYARMQSQRSTMMAKASLNMSYTMLILAISGILYNTVMSSTRG